MHRPTQQLHATHKLQHTHTHTHIFSASNEPKCGRAEAATQNERTEMSDC